MSTDFPFDLPTDKFCIEDWVDALESMWQKICDLEENPPAPLQEGAVLADGSIPMTGCLELPSGCLNDEHAVRWEDLRDLLSKTIFRAVVDVKLDSNGCTEVDFTEEMKGKVAVTVTQGKSSALANPTGEGTVQGFKVTATSTSTTICCYDKDGNPIKDKSVILHVHAIAGE